MNNKDILTFVWVGLLIVCAVLAIFVIIQPRFDINLEERRVNRVWNVTTLDMTRCDLIWGVGVSSTNNADADLMCRNATHLCFYKKYDGDWFKEECYPIDESMTEEEA